MAAGRIHQAAAEVADTNDDLDGERAEAAEEELLENDYRLAQFVPCDS